MTAARRVSAQEFKTALYRAFGGGPLQRPWRLGIAVSGGVDSMALATLCKDLRAADEQRGITLDAFVVDHKLRPTSTAQALQTRDRLREMDITTEILELQWLKNAPSSRTLEREARQQRFRALGRACYKKNIQTLLLGHHANDQMETILWRTVKGYTQRGLSGIRSLNAIPECEGMHGLDSSGALDRANRKGSSDMGLLSLGAESGKATFNMGLLSKLTGPVRHGPAADSRPTKRDDLRKSFGHTKPILYEYGGVNICRPLLSFTKDRLLATCLDEGVGWEEDESNADRTLGGRNAIRHIVKNHRLPAALQLDNVLRLCALIDRRKTSRAELALELLRESDIMVDARSAAVYVRLPSLHVQERVLGGAHLEDELHDEQQSRRRLSESVCLNYVTLLRSLVSGRSAESKGLGEAVLALFPILSTGEGQTVRNVVPLDEKVSAAGNVFKVCRNGEGVPQAWLSLFAPRERRFPDLLWRLSALPPAANRRRRDQITVHPRPSRSAVPASRHASAFEQSRAYWMRIHNPSTSHTLIVRSITSVDVSAVKDLLPKDQSMRFSKMLMEVAPDKTVQDSLLAIAVLPACPEAAAYARKPSAKNTQSEAEFTSATGPEIEALQTKLSYRSPLRQLAAEGVVIALPSLGYRLPSDKIALAIKIAEQRFHKGHNRTISRDEQKAMLKATSVTEQECKEWDDFDWEIRYREIISSPNLKLWSTAATTRERKRLHFDGGGMTGGGGHSGPRPKAKGLEHLSEALR